MRLFRSFFASVALALAFTFTASASPPGERGKVNKVSADMTDVYATVADIERQSDPSLGGSAVRLLVRRDDGAGYKTLVTTDAGFKVEPRFNVQRGERVDTLVIYESETVTRDDLLSAEVFDVFADDLVTFDRYERDAGSSHPRRSTPTREHLIPLKLNHADETPVNDA